MSISVAFIWHLMRGKWLTHFRENLIWKYASILPKRVDNWITSFLDFPTWQLTMTVMLRWIYTDKGIKGKRLSAILRLAWMCYVRITSTITCKQIAWNDWMKQVGEMKHIFKLRFLGHAEIIYYACMKCHMKAKTLEF